MTGENAAQQAQISWDNHMPAVCGDEEEASVTGGVEGRTVRDGTRVTVESLTTEGLWSQ